MTVLLHCCCCCCCCWWWCWWWWCQLNIGVYVLTLHASVLTVIIIQTLFQTSDVN